MARSHQTLSGLVDELLTRPIGAGRNPLEEHHHDLSDPSLHPGAGFLAGQLSRAVAARQRVWVEPCSGMEIPLAAMLRAGGVANASRLAPGQMADPADLVLAPGTEARGGRSDIQGTPDTANSWVAQ